MKKFATLDQIRDKEVSFYLCHFFISLFHRFSLHSISKNDEKKTEYYAGGTDGHGGGSGLNVIDPATSNDPMQKIINNAMKDSNEMSGQNPPEGMRKITLYRNGFTVDDGPLRDLESPENRQFIDALSQGYIPKEV